MINTTGGTSHSNDTYCSECGRKIPMGDEPLSNWTWLSKEEAEEIAEIHRLVDYKIIEIK